MTITSKATALLFLPLVAACSSQNERVVAKSPIDTSVSHKESSRDHVTHRLDTIHIGIGDIGDTLTTAHGIWNIGAVEANPILAPFGDAVPVILIPAKYGLKKIFVRSGVTPAKANITVDAAGMLGTCANLATIAGAAPQVAIPIGIACSVIYRNEIRKDYEAKTGRTLDGEDISPKG